MAILKEKDRVFNTCQGDMFSFGGSHESCQDFQLFFFRRVFYFRKPCGWLMEELMEPGFVPFDLHLGSLGPCY